MKTLMTIILLCVSTASMADTSDKAMYWLEAENVGKCSMLLDSVYILGATKAQIKQAGNLANGYEVASLYFYAMWGKEVTGNFKKIGHYRPLLDGQREIQEAFLMDISVDTFDKELIFCMNTYGEVVNHVVKTMRQTAINP